MRRLLAGLLVLAALPCFAQSAAPLATSAGTLAERTLTVSPPGTALIYSYEPAQHSLNGVCIVVTNKGGVWRSTDYGVTFAATGVTVGNGTSDYPYSLIWTGAQFVYGTRNGSATYLNLYTSEDGLTWRPRPNPCAGAYTVESLGWDGQMLLAGCATSGFSYAYSPALWFPIKRVPALGSRAVAWNGTKWLSVNATAFMQSTDGWTWTSAATAFGGTYWSIATNGTRWVVGAAGGSAADHLWHSDDLVTWTPHGSVMGGTSSNYGAWAVVWTGTRFVASGYGTTNSLAYSDDGATWTGLGVTALDGSPSGYATPKIAWNGQYVVALGILNDGVNNSYATSPDGINWTGRGALPGISADTPIAVSCSPEPNLFPPRP